MKFWSSFIILLSILVSIRSEISCDMLWAYGTCSKDCPAAGNQSCTYYCDYGWYSSPAVVNNTIYTASYSVAALNSTDGSTIWKVKTGNDKNTLNPTNAGRTWPSVVYVPNFTGHPAIITAHAGGWLSAYDLNGQFYPGFPVQVPPSSAELRALSVGYLNGKDLSIIVGTTQAASSHLNIYVYDTNGQIRSGFPQIKDSSNGYSAGIYNNNFCLADIDFDGNLDIIIGTDVHYINAFSQNGTSLKGYNQKYWGQIGAFVNLDTEKIGYGPCTATSGTLRSNFATASCSVYKIENAPKIAIAGNTHDCGFSPYKDVFTSLYLFNADRSRYVNTTRGSEFNWESPLNTGAPLSEDYNLVQNLNPNIAIGDINGDGFMDFIFPAYDGKIYAFSENKKPLSSNFPFSLMTNGQTGIEYASEVALADIDNDGTGEIIFATWAENGSGKYGSLIILSHYGEILVKKSLPSPGSQSQKYGGCLGSPTLFKDAITGNLKIVLNTIHAGNVLYEIPNSSKSRIIWGTSKGSYMRNGNSNSEEVSNPNSAHAIALSLNVFALIILLYLLF